MPLEHALIGTTACALALRQPKTVFQWRSFLFVAISANLPDLDVLAGLILTGNACTFHRGVTHSLLFSLAAGLALSHTPRFWRRIPSLGFPPCLLVVLSHVAADALLTASQVSLLWPFEVHVSVNRNQWGDVLKAFVRDPLLDGTLLFICLCLLVFGNRRGDNAAEVLPHPGIEKPGGGGMKCSRSQVVMKAAPGP
jgi:membrane-bound metal-dependent hydrolase YbcI (DUF457 family)